MILSEEQIKCCKQKLSSALGEKKLPFPKVMSTGKVMSSEYYEYVNRGLKSLKFQIEKLKDSFIIDYYYVTDNSSRHGRIEELGNNIILENYEGQYGWPVFDEEEKTKKEQERIKFHNKRIHKIIKKMGWRR